jgi:hypothetical protein
VALHRKLVFPQRKTRPLSLTVLAREARSMEKYTFEQVKEFFEAEGCTLLSKEYRNSKQKLEYVCSCGNKATKELRNLLSGRNGCKKCSTRRALETTRKKYDGKLYFETTEFLERRKKTFLKKYGVDSPLKSKSVRAKREQTNLSRYGVAHVSKVPEIRQRQKDGLFKNWGVEYTMQSPEILRRYKDTLMERYGVPSMAFLSRCSSKESQEFFWKIHSILAPSLKEKSYFAELNQEFVVAYKGEHFKYDFVNSLAKKAIEYNGSKFHPKPTQEDSEVGWCVFHPLLTVRSAREKEQLKFEALQVRGYEILVVWDFECHKDPNAQIRKCVEFLTRGSQPCC